jgi:diaminopimelate epimerase
MRFEKWQALGNDYLIVEQDQLAFQLTRGRISRLCDIHRGVGADGVLLLAPSANAEHVADLRIFNPDGSEAELSGNGAREAILYLRRRGWTDREEFAIGTVAGEIRPTITGVDTCRVDMGRASLTSKDFPGGPADGVGELVVGNAEGLETWRFRHVSIGNPQCAIAMVDMEMLGLLDLEKIGSEIEGHPYFPNRTNVSLYMELEQGPPARIRARIYERGVGETLSSGTGATGAAVAYVLEHDEDRRGDSATRVTVVLDGGELEVEVGEDLRVNLTGWARPVYEGRLSDQFVRELKEIDEIE